MGKGTDKLYITHSEWSSGDAYSASVGSRASGQKQHANAPSGSRRLPYNYCSLSLQPFKEPVCTCDGTIFDLTRIVAWLLKEKTNPVDGSPLKRSDLITLYFAKNDDGEYVDPVTYKVFTENTHIVALRTTGNVFAWDTIEKFNIKPKSWNDLVNDQPFTRQNIITLQDPHNIQTTRSLVKSHKVADQDDIKPEGGAAVTASSERVLKAREAVEQARRKRQGVSQKPDIPKPSANTASKTGGMTLSSSKPGHLPSDPAKNFAHYTTGKAAASFTSTGLTPHTEAKLATLSEEEYLLRPHTIKETGFIRMETSVGDMTLEVFPEYAPRAVWNMLRLAEKGYYQNVPFHRNLRNFMIQGGDPQGTGKGGNSIWNRPFVDETDGPLCHDRRGTLSMANKGKDTNTSQFFITYKACKHLDKKHTVFGRIVEEENGSSLITLRKLEDLSSDSQQTSGPVAVPVIRDIIVLIDPFQKYIKRSDGQQDGPLANTLNSSSALGTTSARFDQVQKARDDSQDDAYTWTGKRIRNAPSEPSVEQNNTKGTTGVGKYLHSAVETALHPNGVGEVGFEDEVWDERVNKKPKSSGNWNFSGW